MFHRDPQLNSKTLRFTVINVTDKQIIDNIIQTGQNPLQCCENLVSVGYVGYDVLLLNRNKCMSLQDGMDNVRKELNLIETPVRITLDEDLPDEYFLDNLSSFIQDDETHVKLQGEITRSELRALVASAYSIYQRQIEDTHFTKRTRNNILDYFLKRQNWYKVNNRYIEFIFENRYTLYDALVTLVYQNNLMHSNIRVLVRGIEKKLFDHKVHEETLKVLEVPNYLIHDRQMESYFGIVMRNIDNDDQVKIMTQEFRKNKPASASMTRKTVLKIFL